MVPFSNLILLAMLFPHWLLLFQSLLWYFLTLLWSDSGPLLFRPLPPFTHCGFRWSCNFAAVDFPEVLALDLGLDHWGENPVLEGWIQAGFAILRVDNAFTMGSTSLGESSYYLAGLKSRLESGPWGMDWPILETSQHFHLQGAALAPSVGGL